MSDFNFIEERRKQIPEETKVWVKMSLDILERIEEIMQEKLLTNTSLAKSMGKKLPEISKWINGTQNFTIKTIAKLQVALGDEIISIPCRRNKVFELDRTQQVFRKIQKLSTNQTDWISLGNESKRTKSHNSEPNFGVFLFSGPASNYNRLAKIYTEWIIATMHVPDIESLNYKDNNKATNEAI